MFQMRIQSLKKDMHTVLLLGQIQEITMQKQIHFFGGTLYILYFTHMSHLVCVLVSLFKVFAKLDSLSLKHASSDNCHLLISFASSFSLTADLKHKCFQKQKFTECQTV